MPSGNSAQQFLAVETIRDNTVILKNGGLRVILMCSSINFALKAAEEQDAITFQYQNFLNSLDFSLQLLIHSRRFNIAPYLESLKERQAEESNELLKIQITEYMEFIRTFVNMTNIMSKTFYAIVPFDEAIIEKGGVLNKITSALGMKSGTQAGDPFEVKKTQAWQRVDTVIEGLRRFGVRAAPLETEELIELFYGLYNPTEFEKVGGGETKQQPV